MLYWQAGSVLTFSWRKPGQPCAALSQMTESYLLLGPRNPEPLRHLIPYFSTNEQPKRICALLCYVRLKRKRKKEKGNRKSVMRMFSGSVTAPVFFFHHVMVMCVFYRSLHPNKSKIIIIIIKKLLYLHSYLIYFADRSDNWDQIICLHIMQLTQI